MYHGRFLSLLSVQLEEVSHDFPGMRSAPCMFMYVILLTQWVDLGYRGVHVF